MDVISDAKHLTFFFIFRAPRIYHRGTCLRRRHNERRRLEARVIQLSLAGRLGAERAPHGMTADDRREFVSNVLVIKHVVVQDVDAATLKEMEHEKSDLIISQSLSSTQSDAAGDQDDDLGGGIATCTICLTEYQEGEEVCWSHNDHCNHVFHKECILEWLLRHDECPCCRHNFLSIEDIDEENPVAPPNDVDEPEAHATGAIATASSHSGARSDLPHPEEADVTTSWISAIYVARGLVPLGALNESAEEPDATAAEADSETPRDRPLPSLLSNPVDANTSVQDTCSDVYLSSSTATSVELEADMEYSASEP